MSGQQRPRVTVGTRIAFDCGSPSPRGMLSSRVEQLEAILVKFDQDPMKAAGRSPPDTPSRLLPSSCCPAFTRKASSLPGPGSLSARAGSVLRPLGPDVVIGIRLLLKWQLLRLTHRQMRSMGLILVQIGGSGVHPWKVQGYLPISAKCAESRCPLLVNPPTPLSLCLTIRRTSRDHHRAPAECLQRTGFILCDCTPYRAVFQSPSTALTPSPSTLSHPHVLVVRAAMWSSA